MVDPNFFPCSQLQLFVWIWSLKLKFQFLAPVYCSLWLGSAGQWPTICREPFHFNCFIPVAVFSSNTPKFFLCLSWSPPWWGHFPGCGVFFFLFPDPAQEHSFLPDLFLLFSPFIFFFLFSYTVLWSFPLSIRVLGSFARIHQIFWVNSSTNRWILNEFVGVGEPYILLFCCHNFPHI